MNDDFERNKSEKTPQDVAVEGIVKQIEDRQRSYEVDLGYARYVEERTREEWPREGYGEPVVFVDAAAMPVLIARFEDEHLYDNRGLIKPDADAQYRFYLAEETRAVVIPHELAGKVPQSLDSDTIQLYDTSGMGLFEVALRDDAKELLEGIQWLQENIGESLTIERPQLSPARLQVDGEVTAVALRGFSTFRESDF